MKRASTWLLAALAVATVSSIFILFQRDARRNPWIASSNAPDLGRSRAAARLKTISFVHFNDFHAHYQPHDYHGQSLSPLSLLRGYCDQVKAENPNTLFCSAGDEMEKGSLADLLSHGAATIEIYKELGLDLRALGNHDFAHGLETLKRFVTEPGGVVLCANQSIAKDYHQLEIDGVRIGVFSMVVRPYDERDEQYDGPYFKGVDCRYDFIELARQVIRKHRDKVDLLFMLSHLGLGTDEQLAVEAPGLDFIIGGHSHTLLTQPKRSPQGTVIVQAGSYGEYVGRLDVMVDPQSHKMAAHRYTVTRVDPGNMAPTMQLESKIREICRRYEPDRETSIATLAKPLPKIEVARLAGEAAMAVLKTDAAVIDLETVWDSLGAGPRTRQDLLDCFRVEIEPPGTHGFNAIMTANVRASDWQAMRRQGNARFLFVGEPEARGQETLRVALQRRTAMRVRDFFAQVASLNSIEFEMEMWEAMAKHLTSRKSSGPAATIPTR